MKTLIGQPVDRVEGKLKVTGSALYSAEYKFSNLAHGFCVEASITKGRIKSIDVRKAETSPGVIAVFTHENAGKLHAINAGKSEAMPGEFWPPLQDDVIFYNGQIVALVVAETYEYAQYAATQVRVEYEAAKPVLEIGDPDAGIYEPKKNDVGQVLQLKRGDFAEAWAAAVEKIEETYITPIEHHNPMEPHATIAVWDGDELTLHDSTQGVMSTRAGVAEMLGVKPDKVRVISLFLGGGFGCKGALWARPVLAAMAAQKIERPVKIAITRQQMFTQNGHRPKTVQSISLAANRNGELTGIRHLTTVAGSTVTNFIEPSGAPTEMLYACPHLEVHHTLVRLDHPGPTFMRAPGEASGMYGLECAMDELSYKLKMDPIRLRLANYTDTDAEEKKPFSSKHLKECYRRGAEAIGWDKRNPEPGSMRDGEFLIGYGMATATYPGLRWPATAKVELLLDGHAVAESATQDLGTGTYTIMTQIAAEELGLPISSVDFRLGDSKLPMAPISGGSASAASVGPAVRAAARACREKVIRLAIKDEKSPLHDQSMDSIAVENGRVFLRDDHSKGETYHDILSRNNLPKIEADGKAAPDDKRHSFHSFGAQFVVVKVDPLLGSVRVARCVSVMDIGRVLNHKTARSQVIGGVVFGIGMALLEHTVFDPNVGRIVTRDLANYLVPVHADIPEIDVQFIGEPDFHFNPLGARGVGEIGITGTAAAVANAVYHATGKRIRELPITSDKLL